MSVVPVIRDRCVSDAAGDSIDVIDSPSDTSVTAENSLESLSRHLQTICQSPASASKLLHRHSQMSTGSIDQGNSGLPAQPALAAVGRHSSGDSSGQPCTGAAVQTVLRPGCRPLRVHHEETCDKLRQSLAKICSSGNNSPTASATTLNTTQQTSGGPAAAEPGRAHPVPSTKNYGLRVRESLKSGVRARVDVSGVSPANVVVAVHGGCQLQVHSAVDPEHCLYSQTIPAQTQLMAVACSITEDGQTLIIRERSKQFMHLEHCFTSDLLDAGNQSSGVAGQQQTCPGDSSPQSATTTTSTTTSSCSSTVVYLPVVQQIESQPSLNISLHIASNFAFEDMIVNTKDDRLVIKAKQCSAAATSMTLMLCLPEGTDTRSVKAQFAGIEHQLIVSATSSPANSCRRMTCTF